ncbi:hypothetical protein SAMN05660690_1788 [Geodermatophilus telluris]|uniref:Uncharacterized protein n=1 Tax=Geodermatophilus telluris TaxID=1190417 RepID=A0A1G6MCH5_9ACTN|nr:DUF6518 family protein [Geodermatophilus telluris]SDC53160.1 hypothetical protein SAMN05660690_1788 [Geodermatophilus telluris]
MDGRVGGALTHPRRAAVPLRLLVAVSAGVLTGGLAAWAYHDDVLRPLSHVFLLWTATIALLSARQPWRRAVVVSSVTLLAAVLAFYVGKQVVYGIEYPGMPYALDTGQVLQWLVLAVVAGAVLGVAFAGIGTPGRAGSIGTAAALGLLVADAYRRASSYPAEAPVVVTAAVLAAAAVLAVALRSPRQLPGIAAWTVPAVLAGLVLVSAPDLLEQLLLTGRP